MAWINMISEADARGRLAELYKRYEESWGGVDNILKLSRQSNIDNSNN